MSTITLSTDNPRSLKAVQLAVNSGQWLTVTTSTGQKASGVESQRNPGTYYLTTPTSCSCPDSRYRPRLVCKHQLALRLRNILAAV